MFRRTVGLTTLLLIPILGLASPARAGAEVKPVAPKSSQVLHPDSMYTSQFATAPKGAGLVHPGAAVAVFKTAWGKLLVAVDADKADAAQPDLLRLDFTGTGKFGQAPTVPMKISKGSGSYINGQISPATIDVQHGNQTFPVSVRGSYYRSKENGRLSLQLLTGVEGPCTIGQREYTVRIIDGNSNLSLTDKGQLTGSASQPTAMHAGDTVIVSGGEAEPIKGMYGQPLLIEGKWYDVSLTANGQGFTAQPLAIQTAQIKIAHERWAATFACNNTLMWYEGGTEPVSVPAQRLELVSYTEETGASARGRHGELTVSSLYQPRSRIKAWTPQAGKTLDLAIGSPLTASIEASRRGREMELSLKLLDAAGTPVRDLTLVNGQRPPEPTFQILAPSGQVVYSGKLEYG